jgi:hypothetical protein
MDSEEKFESALQARDGQGVDNPLKKRRPYVKPAFEYEPVVEAVAHRLAQRKCIRGPGLPMLSPPP